MRPTELSICRFPVLLSDPRDWIPINQDYIILLKLSLLLSLSR